jgi:3-isopropylmalate/(R)-2-methylmalate dehydratase small subunit
MKPWNDIDSELLHVTIDHIDTDMIIPAQFLTSTSKEGYAEGLFKSLRESSSDFALNNYKPFERRILLSGANFGCGSSREHAVWALVEYGITVVIAESFADIFRANALKNGLLPVVLPLNKLTVLRARGENSGDIVSVLLESEEVFLNGELFSRFSIEPFRKYCLMNGIDDLDYILEHKEEIDQFVKSKESVRFYSSNHVIV